MDGGHSQDHIGDATLYETESLTTSGCVRLCWYPSILLLKTTISSHESYQLHFNPSLCISTASWKR